MGHAGAQARARGLAMTNEPQTPASDWEGSMTYQGGRSGGACSTAAALLLLSLSAAAVAQVPTAANPWAQAAPFPEPSEEVLGATANGKLYVFAGLAPE